MISVAAISLLILTFIVGVVYRVLVFRVFVHYGICFLAILVGGGLNGLVMSVNGGLMPVDISGMSQYVEVGDGYVALSEFTRLPFLADIIPTSPSSLASAGDFIILLGAVYLFSAVLILTGRRNKVTLGGNL